MGKYEVTQKQWKHIIPDNPSYFQENFSDEKNYLPTGTNGDKLPVEKVSWNDITEKDDSGNFKETTFLYKLKAKAESENLGKSFDFRLPTKAQWEYADRGGVAGQTYSGSGDLNIVGWHRGGAYSSGWDNGTTSAYKTKGMHEVGKMAANVWGVKDMSGNVWEWCLDSYDEHYGSYTQSHRAFFRLLLCVPWR